jgi:hypothetical protein
MRKMINYPCPTCQKPAAVTATYQHREFNYKVEGEFKMLRCPQGHLFTSQNHKDAGYKRVK